MAEVVITGDSRDAVLLRIVAALAFSEGKTSNPNALAISAQHFSREWMKDAFAFARECLDGPKPARAEDFLAVLAEN